MGTTYKGIYIPDAGEDNWDVAVNANWTRIADRDELVRKSAPESVTSSTTLQNDDHLVYVMTASHTWAFKLCILPLSAGGMALRGNFTVPASATWTYVATGRAASGDVVTVRDSVTGPSDFVSNALVATAQAIVFEGVVTCGATAGNFQFQWAQSVSNASAVTVATNSYLLMKLLV